MQTFILIFLSVLSLALLAGIFLLYKKIQETGKPKEGDQNLFLMLQNQIQDLNQTVEKKISESSRLVNETQNNIHKNHADAIRPEHQNYFRRHRKLTKLDETNKQILGFSDQLQTLEETLNNPKHRGILGEYYLENVLKMFCRRGAIRCNINLATAISWTRWSL